ncbi:MAG: 6-phosphogluconolactonase [Elusimicrobiota bacterium]
MRRVQILQDAASLAAAAAEEFARAAAASSGPFRVALSGGSTPKALNRFLADPAASYRARVPWDRVHFFWSDERCVPPDDPDSNYRMARETLLSRVPVPAAHIHRIPAEMPNPDESADIYEETIVGEFDGLPHFDWIFLGMGADGHAASLFPGNLAVAEQKKLVTAVWLPQMRTHRVSFTLPTLNAARKIVFLVSGPEKAETARLVLEEAPSAALPSSLVQPMRGELLWLLDKPAAQRLKT